MAHLATLQFAPDPDVAYRLLQQRLDRNVTGAPDVLVRILQRLLALTAVIWHNHHTRQPIARTLTAYDH